MEYLLQAVKFTTCLFHLYLVFPKTKDQKLERSGQGYTHSHLSTSLVWSGKAQKKAKKKKKNERFHFVSKSSLKLLINLLDHIGM